MIKQNLFELIFFAIALLLSLISIFVIGYENYFESTKLFFSSFTTKSAGIDGLFAPITQLQAFIITSVPLLVLALMYLVKLLFINKY